MHNSPRRTESGQNWWVSIFISLVMIWFELILIVCSFGHWLIAIIVRYLTGRFIGEYYSGNDMIYGDSFPYFGTLTTRYDIVDVSNLQERQDGDLLSWSERSGAFVIVYALTDLSSLAKAVEILQRLPRSAPKFLMANKLDLQHRRQVCHHVDFNDSAWTNEVFSTTQVNFEEGQKVADEYGCSFVEISASENNLLAVKCVFHKLIRQLLIFSYMRPRPHFTMLSRLFGSIVLKTARRRKTVTKTSSTSSSSSTKSSSSSILTSNSFRLLRIWKRVWYIIHCDNIRLCIYLT